MSEPITLKGMCGKPLQGKLWKQGGSLKCPQHWSVITYPRPTLMEFWRDLASLCRDCEDDKT